MADLPRGMEHIERKELYTSLPARVRYLQQFLEFGPGDVAALQDGQPYIKRVMPNVVTMVYRKLLQHDITARVFSNRDSRNDMDPEVWAKEDSSTIQNRKIFLRWYLTKLSGDPTEPGYWEYLDKVGFMHVGLGRRNALHVEYIFLGACLGYIQDSITEAILLQPTLSMRRKIAIIKAFGKVIWIQNDLLARWHVSEGDEFKEPPPEAELPTELPAEPVEPRDYSISERSPSLYTPSLSGDAASIYSSSSGRTSIGRSIDEVRPSTGSTVSRCPFSGMVLDGQRAELARPAKKDLVQHPNPLRQHPPPSGAPKLYLVDGRTVCKEKLEPNPFD